MLWLCGSSAAIHFTRVFVAMTSWLITRRRFGTRASVRQMRSTAAAAEARCRLVSISAAGVAAHYAALLSIPGVRTITTSILSYSDALHLTMRCIAARHILL